MGSASDMPHAEKIVKECQSLGVPCEVRVMSAHKATQETLNILAEYEGQTMLFRSLLLHYLEFSIQLL